MRVNSVIGKAGLCERLKWIWHLARHLIPGVLLCGTIALASHHLSGVLGGPVFVPALLLGVAFHGLCMHERVSPGVELCARTLLRWGVALLGARVTWAEITGLGWWPPAVVVVGVGTTMAFGVWLSSRLRMPRWQGVLSGGATAICGASAALALSAVLPKNDERERFTLLVVVGVTALSTVAMLVYPLLVHLLALSSSQAAVFLGGSIHDVAQVVAAGLMISEETGTKATVIKLMRVALLAVVVVGVALAYRQ